MAAPLCALRAGCRAASTAAAAAVKTATHKPASRLHRLRQELAESEQASLQEFAGIPAIQVKSADQAAPTRKDPPKPDWLRIDTPTGERKENFDRLSKTVKSLNLATVCEEAKCPNIGECWGGKQGTATATIMIMGDTCTRGCSFCAVKTSNAPPPLDPLEPQRVAEAVASWGLNYVVLTSVDRDELPDQGSCHFAATVRNLKKARPSILVECLTPDFRGVHAPIDLVARSGLDVYAHNIETVERLTPRVRDHRAGYKQSLAVLERAKVAQPSVITKSSIMMGLGEEPEDVRQALRDLRSSGVDVVTFGQYLRPTKRHIAVDRYVTPAEFTAWKAEAEAMGFLYVASGALVRSSYKAGEYFLEALIRGKMGQKGAVDTPEQLQAQASARQALIDAVEAKRAAGGSSSSSEEKFASYGGC